MLINSTNMSYNPKFVHVTRPTTILTNSGVYQSTNQMGSCEILQNLLSWSVQPLWRLLKKTDKQTKSINIDLAFAFALKSNVVDVRYFKQWILCNLSFKYLRFTPSGCKDIGIRKFKLPLHDTIWFTKCLFLLNECNRDVESSIYRVL